VFSEHFYYHIMVSSMMDIGHSFILLLCKRTVCTISGPHFDSCHTMTHLTDLFILEMISIIYQEFLFILKVLWVISAILLISTIPLLCCQNITNSKFKNHPDSILLSTGQ